MRSDHVDKAARPTSNVPCVDCDVAHSIAMGDRCLVVVNGEWRAGEPPTGPPVDTPYRAPSKRGAKLRWRRRQGIKPMRLRTDVTRRKRNKAEALRLIAGGSSQADAARKLKVVPQTVSRYVTEDTR